MVIDNARAVKILTGIQKYCKDKSWCLSCLLGRDDCNRLFGSIERQIPSGWEINLDKSENEFIICREKAVEILTNIKMICGSNKCWTCPLGDGRCPELLGEEVPFDWEIRLCGSIDTMKGEDV